jgi:divalent metal cation (Fe/Co/Zn/Cd) transporter
MEGTSLLQATRQVRREAAEHELSLAGELAGTDDPAPRAVFTEDLAAVIGIVLAAAGVGLHQLTGSAVWDGIASILIGVLLAVVAVLLGKVCKGLLIGRQADPRLVRAVWEHVERQPEVDDLVDVQTMLTGTDKVLVCARVDFVDTYSAGDVEQACIRIDNELRELFHDVDEVFIQPVPRTNADLRDRVLQRYGRALTD